MSTTKKALFAASISIFTSLGTANAATIFSDGFESGNFNAWSYIQGLDTSLSAGPDYNYVTTASKAGVPNREGTYIAHFERPSFATNLQHSKIYKEWSNVGKKDQFGRTETPLPNGGNPSAIYSASFYFPADYSAASSLGWVNLFQFKEEGYIDGVWHQDPDWWLNVSSAAAWNAGGSEPVLFANHWNMDYSTFKPKIMPVPRGRWFEIRAHLYEHDRIEWYVDGQLFDVSRHSVYPVGRFFTQSNGWVFGVGHYGGSGYVLIDDAKVVTLDSAPSPSPTPVATPVSTPMPTPTPTPTPSSGSFTATIEAESSSIHTSGSRLPDGSGWALTSNGEVGGAVSFPASGTYRFTISARGQSAAGVVPRMELRIDGKAVASVKVTSKSYASYTLSASVGAGSHQVTVAFTNDYYAPAKGQDRNLYIDKITITSTSSTQASAIHGGEPITPAVTGTPRELDIGSRRDFEIG